MLKTPVSFTFNKSNSGCIKVSLTEYRGRDYVDVRYHYRSAENKAVPTKKGISIPCECTEEFYEKLGKLLGK